MRIPPPTTPTNVASSCGRSTRRIHALGTESGGHDARGGARDHAAEKTASARIVPDTRASPRSSRSIRWARAFRAAAGSKACGKSR